MIAFWKLYSVNGGIEAIKNSSSPTPIAIGLPNLAIISVLTSGQPTAIAYAYSD
jgi:hypothetical protein